MGNCGCKGQHKDSSQQTKDFVYTKPERQHYHHDGCEDKKHEYFDKYSTLEKQLVAENLGMSCNNTTIQNYPDEEDLTQVVKGNEIVLKFKDKLYDPDKFSGYGRVFLRKNIVSSDGTCGDNKKNILTQDMFKDKDGVSLDHTIFVIQYDYDLNGQFIEIPCNSVLLFAGGSLTNGTIILNGALVLPFGINIDQFILCSTRGKYAAGQVLYKCGKLLFFDGTQWYDLSAITSIDGLNAAVKELTKEIDDLTLIVADLSKKINDDYIINLINNQLTTLGYLTKNDLVGYATKEYVNSLIKNIDLTPLEAKVYANEVDIAGLKSRVSTNESNISSLGIRVTKLENIKKGKLTFTGAVSATYDGSSDLTINIPSGGSPGTITVDSALSTTSTNPVQNKVITEALNKKLEASDFKTVGGESIIGTGDIPFPDPGTGSYVLPAATDSALGGVKTGYTQNDKNYPLQLDGNDKAYVNVPWTGGSGGSTTKYVPYFKNSASTTIDSKLALPTGFSTAGLNGWSATNANPTTAAPYTWICQIEVTDGAFVSAIGPWRITPVDGGSNGTDGTDIEFVFALNNNSTEAPKATGTDNVTQDIDKIPVNKNADYVPGGWTDNPSGVSTSYKYEWCSLRTSVNGTDGKIATYTQFIAPFIWSAYGETGTDGDGVEYIFYNVTNTSIGPSQIFSEDSDPTTWTDDTNFQNDEYIKSNTGWADNPVEMNNQGECIFVSIRKKRNNTWGAYTTPTLWAYYGKDAVSTVVDGYTTDFINDFISVPLNASDDTYNIVQQATMQVLKNGAPQTISSNITFEASKSTSNINSSWFTSISGPTVTVSIPANNQNFRSNKSGVAVFSTVVNGNTLYAAIQFGGIPSGTSGVSYQLRVSPNIIQKSINASKEVSYNTTDLDISGLVSTSTGVSTVTPTSSGYRFAYRKVIGSSVDAGPTTITQSTLLGVTSTMGIKDSGDRIIIYMYRTIGGTEYLVDQENIIVTSDGLPGAPGVGATTYSIQVINSTLVKNSSNKTSGTVNFKVYKTDHAAATTTEITNAASNNFIEYFDATKQNTINISYDTTNKYYSLTITDSTTLTQCLTLQYKTDASSNTIFAVSVVPISITGAQGGTQTLDEAILRVTNWINGRIYSDGTDLINDWYSNPVQVSPFRYKDVVLYTDGYYYVCVKTTTGTELPGNVTYWRKLTNVAQDQVVNNLIANYINAKSISANQLVILKDSSTVVAGMTGNDTITQGTIVNSDTITKNLSYSTSTNNGNIRIFAGTPSNTSLTTCPFYVTDSGYMKATNASIEGIIKANQLFLSNNNIIFDPTNIVAPETPDDGSNVGTYEITYIVCTNLYTANVAITRPNTGHVYVIDSSTGAFTDQITINLEKNHIYQMITTHTTAGEGGTYVIDLTIAQGSSTASLNTIYGNNSSQSTYINYTGYLKDGIRSTLSDSVVMNTKKDIVYFISAIDSDGMTIGVFNCTNKIIFIDEIIISALGNSTYTFDTEFDYVDKQLPPRINNSKPSIKYFKVKDLNNQYTSFYNCYKDSTPNGDRAKFIFTTCSYYYQDVN